MSGGLNIWSPLLGLLGFLAPLTLICVAGMIYGDSWEKWLRKRLGKEKPSSE